MAKFELSINDNNELYWSDIEDVPQCLGAIASLICYIAEGCHISPEVVCDDIKDAITSLSKKDKLKENNDV